MLILIVPLGRQILLLPLQYPLWQLQLLLHIPARDLFRLFIACILHAPLSTIELYLEHVFIMIILFFLNVLYLDFFMQKLALNGCGDAVELSCEGLFYHFVLILFLFVQSLY